MGFITFSSLSALRAYVEVGRIEFRVTCVLFLCFLAQIWFRLTPTCDTVVVERRIRTWTRMTPSLFHTR